MLEVSVKIYCDSSTTQACLVIVGIQGSIIHTYPEQVTNNVGEYKAVIEALVLALTLEKIGEWEEAVILTDSQLVVNQIKGYWKCHTPHLLPYIREARELILKTGAEVDWIPREENLAGLVLDGKGVKGRIGLLVSQDTER